MTGPRLPWDDLADEMSLTTHLSRASAAQVAAQWTMIGESRGWSTDEIRKTAFGCSVVGVTPAMVASALGWPQIKEFGHQPNG